MGTLAAAREQLGAAVVAEPAPFRKLDEAARALHGAATVIGAAGSVIYSLQGRSRLVACRVPCPRDQPDMGAKVSLSALTSLNRSPDW
jgi:hypothetical protein